MPRSHAYDFRQAGYHMRIVCGIDSLTGSSWSGVNDNFKGCFVVAHF